MRTPGARFGRRGHADDHAEPPATTVGDGDLAPGGAGVPDPLHRASPLRGDSSSGEPRVGPRDEHVGGASAPASTPTMTPRLATGDMTSLYGAETSAPTRNETPPGAAPPPSSQTNGAVPPGPNESATSEALRVRTATRQAQQIGEERVGAILRGARETARATIADAQAQAGGILDAARRQGSELLESARRESAALLADARGAAAAVVAQAEARADAIVSEAERAAADVQARAVPTAAPEAAATSPDQVLAAFAATNEHLAAEIRRLARVVGRRSDDEAASEPDRQP